MGFIRQRQHPMVVTLLWLLLNWSMSQTQHVGATAVETPTGAYVAVCLIARDANQDIREWIAYHKCLGVGKFYVYDHLSSTPMSGVLADHISSGLVEYAPFNLDHTRHHKGNQLTPAEFRQTPQGMVYRQCLQEHRSRHRFIAFIDVDEFIVLKPAANTTSLESFLRRFEDVGGLALHWRLFGSSGHQQRPAEGVLPSYLQCLPLQYKSHKVVKTILNTRFQPYLVNAHQVRYRHQGAFTVDEDRRLVPSWKHPLPEQDMISLFHYVTKSREDFEQKAKKGGGDGYIRAAGFIDMIDQQARQGETCPEARDLWRQCQAQAPAA